MFMIWEDIGMRSYMEDRVSWEVDLYKGFSYCSVFDGHGGAEVSTYLQTNMKKTVLEHLIYQDTMESFIDVPKVLFDAFQTIVAAIPRQISEQTGSTAVVMLKKNNKIWLANAGDSRAIMNNGYGSVQLTQDHKPSRHDEYTRIISLGGKVNKSSPEDVYRVNGMLAVSRAIGDFALAPHVTWKPEIHAYTLTNRNHYILLATDGVWDVLENDEVVNIINDSIIDADWKNIGYKLISMSRKKHSQDNIALALMVL